MKARYALLGGLLGASALIAQTAAPLTAILPGRIAAAFRKSGVPSVSVAVVQNGKLAYTQTLGLADVAAGRKADGTTRYPIGSISKQFTAAALLLIEEQGKLSLDDRVSKYFPDLTRSGDISIRQLLSHTSGYEDFAPQDYLVPAWTQPTTSLAVLSRWAKKPLDFEPGAKWEYSNTNYVLAAAIFEKVAGQNLTSFLRERIFQPLEMQSAGDCLPVQAADPLPYTRYALGAPRPVAREASGWYYGAAGLCMTPSDLARWDMAFLEKKILPARSYEEFTQAARLANGDDTHYGLGLQLGEMNGTPMVSHGGEVSGFLAANYVFPTRRAAVVVLSNEDGVRFVGPLAVEIASSMLQPAPARQIPLFDRDTKQVRAILEELQKGHIDPSLFTANANSYFSEVALTDFKSSLTAIGKLKAVSKTGEDSRGGMIHRDYRAEFAKKTVSLNIYVMPDGKFEQFLVEDQI